MINTDELSRPNQALHLIPKALRPLVQVSFLVLRIKRGPTGHDDALFVGN